MTVGQRVVLQLRITASPVRAPALDRATALG
jgi:hypothetical protein